MSPQELWERYKKYCYNNDSIGLAIDISRMNFSDSFFGEMEDGIQEAFRQMSELESGAIANPDEQRMVGHYWLRAPELAPDDGTQQAIESGLAKVKQFAADIHEGRITSESGEAFRNILVVGIGGSALGPQFVRNALGTADDKMKVFFFDNTDPNGIDKVLAEIGDSLDQTLTVVISKSGGTKETRNGMLEAKAAYENAGLDFAKHAVATTMEGSLLHETSAGWLDQFPMWDFVGGRTSEISTVGLLPAALQGIDVDGMLAGAKAMDQVTRSTTTNENPAALLALMWYHAGGGKGQKDMVLLPYKDRLELFSRYLQQLVMESLGKQEDLDGKTVNQGIAVYGNKGSTDQHAYVQQLREGVNNFFVTFIEVLKDRDGESMQVEDNVTSGDYLSGFLQGSRSALYENGRESITLTIDEVNPEAVGKLIALYERAVGFYATLVNINAYHQPGVEAGKKAAAEVLDIQLKILGHLRENSGQGFTADAVADAIGESESVETVFKILQHLAANPDHDVKREGAELMFDATYSA